MKKIITLAIALLPMAVMAQMRIATVDVQAVFNALPEAKAAAEKLDEASKQLKAEYEMMQAEFNDKYEAYQLIASDNKTPQTIKDRRVREIQDGNRDIDRFLAQSKMSLDAQKQTLEAPIYNKINAAIKQVGEDAGYTYIIDVSRSPVVYAGATAVDVTDAVLRVLGVK